MDAVVTRVCRLSDEDAERIVRRLTWPGSEFHEEVKERASMTPIALIRTHEDQIAGWVATHDWRGMQTVEGFTDPNCRRRGVALAAASLLAADGHLNTDDTTAVFSPSCVAIATRVGCRDVRLYERCGGDWVQNS